ncbi:MAG: SH3 domain-containing protein [Succinivibrio sp.]|nr:SH3 domain-containing protein [Succinivibrio sp.]
MCRILLLQTLAAALFLSACSVAEDSSVSSPALTGELTDVGYWLKRQSDPEALLCSSAELDTINASLRALPDSGLQDLAALPGSISQDQAGSLIAHCARHLTYDRAPALYAGKSPLSEAQYRVALANQNLSGLPEQVQLGYALLLRRSAVRVLPTLQGWYSQSGDYNYDNLQMSVLNPGEGVRVVHHSRDGQFAFIVGGNVSGWVRTADLAVAERSVWLSCVRPSRLLVVTAPQLTLDTGTERVLLEMGSTLPYVGESSAGALTRLPVMMQGKLQFSEVTLGDPRSYHLGFLPYTRGNVLRQALRCLGLVYGWGGQNEGVDCSALVQNVYRSMGLYLPRNSRAQISSLLALQKSRGAECGAAERLCGRGVFASGALWYKPGHIALYLGEDERGEGVMLHSLSSYYTREGDRLEKHYLRRVVVSHQDYLVAGGRSFAQSVLDRVDPAALCRCSP